MVSPVIPEAMIQPKVEPMIVEPMVMPWVLPQTRPAVEVQVASRPVQSASPAVSPALEVQEVEELVEEKKEVKDSKESTEEEEIMERFLYIEDKEVSMERKHEIRQAIIKARFEADRLGLKKIAGWLVAKFLPAEHAGVRSQVVKKTGPDGSYEDTVKEIAQTGELESEEDAIRRFDLVVAEKKPVKNGKEGKPVEMEDIARVFKYRIFKPAPVIEIVRSRVIRKRTQAIPVQASVAETRLEKSLEELDPTLAGVFQKTA